ncbi:MAG: ABC transporter substrate-binding protein, partial [Pseudomonadota bacterium]
RLKLAIDANVVTDYTKANGMGGIDMDRFKASLKQIAENYKFKSEPDATKIYTDEYLPSDGSLKLN